MQKQSSLSIFFVPFIIFLASSISGISQNPCGEWLPDFTNWSATNQPPGAPVLNSALLAKRNTDGTIINLADILPGQTHTDTIDIDSVESLVFLTVCRSLNINNSSNGTQCITTFECNNDLLYFTPPTNINGSLIVTAPTTLPPFSTMQIRIYFKQCNLSKPVLISPDDEKEHEENNVTFFWEQTINASKYELQIDTLREISEENPLQQFTVSGLSKSVNNLKNNTTYYWRVRAVKGECKSEWSEIRKFTTKIKMKIFSTFIETGESTLIEELNKETQTEYEYHITADGTNLFKLEVNRGAVSIRDDAGSATSGALEVSGTSGEKLTIKYTAPRTFVRDNVIFLDYKHDPAIESPDFTLVLQVHPVPVVLFHGLASNGSVWGGIMNALVSNGWDFDEVEAPSYANDASFAASSPEVGDYVESIINTARAQNKLTNKASLVGHSMGGLLSRHYLQQNPEAKNISRLITINTPHSGSEIANFVLESEIDGLGIAIADFVFGGTYNNSSGSFNIMSGALSSLRVNSPEILSLNTQPSGNVPVHAISSDFELCDYIGDDDVTNYTAALEAFFDFSVRGIAASACYFLESHIGEQNDGVVRLSSQQGGLGGAALNFYQGISPSYSHTGIVEAEDIVEDLLPTLLGDDTQSSAFAYGFSPVLLPPPLKQDMALNEDITADTNNVEIIILNVASGDTLFAQNKPTINIEGAQDVNGIMLMYKFVALDTIIFDTINTNTHAFKIPLTESYSGKVHLVAMGTNGIGAADVDTLTFFMRQQTTSISIINKDVSNITVFPNPASRQISINANSPIYQIRLFDLRGKLILENWLTQSQYNTKIEIPSGLNGAYHLTIHHSGGVTSRIIMIE